MENFTEKTQYFLRENTSGREDNACRFSCEFAKEGMIFCFDVRDEDIISPFTQDNEDLWRADAVEVFLSPNGDLHNYKEIEVSPFGMRFYGDIYNSDGKTAALTKKTPAYQAWAEQTDGGYSVKIVIGYDSLEGFDRAKMKLNAYRLDKKQSGEQLLYALNPTMCGSFHRPQYFIGEAKK